MSETSTKVSLADIGEAEKHRTLCDVELNKQGKVTGRYYMVTTETGTELLTHCTVTEFGEDINENVLGQIQNSQRLKTLLAESEHDISISEVLHNLRISTQAQLKPYIVATKNPLEKLPSIQVALTDKEIAIKTNTLEGMKSEIKERIIARYHRIINFYAGEAFIGNHHTPLDHYEDSLLWHPESNRAWIVSDVYSVNFKNPETLANLKKEGFILLEAHLDAKSKFGEEAVVGGSFGFPVSFGGIANAVEVTVANITEGENIYRIRSANKQSASTPTLSTTLSASPQELPIPKAESKIENHEPPTIKVYYSEDHSEAHYGNVDACFHDNGESWYDTSRETYQNDALNKHFNVYIGDEKIGKIVRQPRDGHPGRYVETFIPEEDIIVQELNNSSSPNLYPIALAQRGEKRTNITEALRKRQK